MKMVAAVQNLHTHYEKCFQAGEVLINDTESMIFDSSGLILTPLAVSNVIDSREVIVRRVSWDKDKYHVQAVFSLPVKVVTM